MSKAIALLFVVTAGIAAAHESNNSTAVAAFMQSWQARIVAQNLQVEDAKNWSKRNMAKFGRLNAERLALAYSASTLEELEMVLVEAPLADGARLDVLMANKPGDISMMGTHGVTKSSPATAPAAYSNLVFTALTTCRIMDTRVSQGGSGAWAAGSTNTIKIGPYPTGYQTGAGAQGGSATSCGLDALAGPGEVAVVMAAVSTVSQAGPGYLTFYPNGAPNPGLTAVSQWYQAGYVQTSFVLIPTDLVGTVAATGFTSATTDVIVDVVGYFVRSFMHNTGSGNTFVGEDAGNFTLTGSGNTGLGFGALQLDTSGSANTAGGDSALSSNTSGGGNVAFGFGALSSNTTGTSNVAFGVSALGGNTTGGSNIALGSAAGFSATGSNNILIGNVGVAAENDTIRIGSNGSHTKTFIAAIRNVTTDAANAVPVLIDSGGQLGTFNSSRYVKDDIYDMANASSALMKLRPVTFYYKSDRAPERTLQYGLVAEEVAGVYPGLVAHSNDGKIETVMYQFLPPMLLNEYQKQQRTIEAQAQRIEALELQAARTAKILEELQQSRR